MVVIYENRYDEHKKYTAMRTIFVLLGLLAASVTVKAQCSLFVNVQRKRSDK